MKNRVFFVAIGLMFGLTGLLSCSSSDLEPESVNNEYELDGVLYGILTDMFWESSAGQGGADHLRLLEPLPDSNLFDLILIIPVPGPSSLEGTYVYSKTGDIGTYNLNFIHATNGEGDSLWSTNGDFGEQLEIQSMGKSDGREVYRIILPEFSLNYGYWDYLAGNWVSLGKKKFRLSYEGVIL